MLIFAPAMDREIRIFNFKTLPIEIEVKDLMFVRELPKLLGQPHKANFWAEIYHDKTEMYYHAS